MDWLWNWGGECFGYREGDSLFTYFGKEIGRFDGEEIFGNNGRYLGEVMKPLCGGRFAPKAPAHAEQTRLMRA
jgi:hypothetical protein